MAYNYVVTAQPPTTVTHSLVASFTGPDALNLIVCRCTRIEIYVLEAQGLQLLHDVPLYGRVATMDLWKPAGKGADRLFLSTERYQFCILAYDAAKAEIVTEAKGDVSDRIGRPADAGQIAVIEPNHRLIGLHLYDGLFKVVPAIASGSLEKEAFNIRLEELHVLDMVFLHGMPKPTLALLYQDVKEGRHLKTYEVQLKEKDFGDGPWAQANLEAGASRLIAVTCGGVLVLGEQSITYHSGSDFKSLAIPFASFRAYEPIDGARFLLADHLGRLSVLVLDVPAPQGPVRGLMMEPMGTTSAASSLSYLTDGLAFVGSAFGDSQLVQLLTEANEGGQYVQEVQRWSNLGPIVDFCVVDLERHGQGQLVTCSGAYRDGSLRVVRNGIGIHEAAQMAMPGIKGLWSARVCDVTYLVLAFISETRVLAMVEDELGEVDADEGGGFDLELATVCCAALGPRLIAQVTTSAVRLIDGQSLRLLDSWSPHASSTSSISSSISMAAVDGQRVLLATPGQGGQAGQLHLLQATDGNWLSLASSAMAHEVACLALSGAPPPLPRNAMQTDDVGDPTAAAGRRYAAAGLWTDLSVRLLDADTLAELVVEPLGGSVIPRSLAFAPFGEALHLLCALGDGHLVTFTVEAAIEGGSAAAPDDAAMVDALPPRPPTASASSAAPQLTDRKTVALGTKPIALTPFHTHGALHVFASSDRPSIIHASSGKLVYANLNLKDATHMAPFDGDGSSPDTLAIASEESLVIGTVDEIRKLHIRNFPLGEQPRRLAHLERAKAFALLSMRVDVAPDGEESESGFIRLLDETTLERLASFELQPYESPCSLLHLALDDAADGAPVLLVVGTAYARADEPEPTAGRILVLDVRERSLELLTEARIKGACYALEALGSCGILAGVNNKLQLYDFVPAAAGASPSVRLRGEHCGHILVLYIAARGDFILVGDLMKSVSVLQCTPATGNIVELARDCSANWMTAVAFLDDDTYLGAENSLNLFVTRKHADAATDDERSRLEVVGEFHLGEFVNRFRKGSLAMHVTESGAASIPTLLFATVNGVLGVVASLPAEDFTLLSKVQSNLTRVIQGVGGLSHAAWRSFKTERKTADARNVLDGDLIEAFLSLRRPQMEQVVEGIDISVEELCKRIEELQRLH